MHSYQKIDPQFEFETFKNQQLVRNLLDVLNKSNESYRTKEKALHLVNEMLFYNLTNSKN